MQSAHPTVSELLSQGPCRQRVYTQHATNTHTTTFDKNVGSQKRVYVHFKLVANLTLQLLSNTGTETVGCIFLCISCVSCALAQTTDTAFERTWRNKNFA